ncbi:coproporphyrinogen-III oxidase family protein [Anaerosacchariphilus polymeriproducens]|uniref:Heme chaperone HemW n=1 Tax=Anaerosacchariphilus polymeriproducens TaxID=1812858 RepID=A0A371AUG3_9FIRM|nr:radical SAM protein [Anaerosacchariphilus polymeriproducens]RDU23214.1 radical SAM protein [Anaerosacchariphilus polymeriproducens]
MSKLTSFARIWLTRSFKPFYFSNTYDSVLEYEDTDNLGLYVHIPFCRKICTFCPYCKVVYNKDDAKLYVKALLKEIEMVGHMRKKEKKEVTSLYFGGGTPALLIEDIRLIVTKIKENFIITEGIGLELHPNDVTVENLKTLKASGITKISIGIQSFQSEFLELLGRSSVEYESMFQALKEVAFETVSMDFIFALPGQTFEHIKKDIEIAFNNQANHVAIYPFIDFSFTSHTFSLMSNQDKKRLLFKIVSYCNEKGYERDSIWTFSKNGKARYSSMTRENFLGFGCSATTLLKEQFKINTFDVNEYIERISGKTLPTSLAIKFTLRQRMVYYLFWTFYTMKLYEGDFNKFFNKKLLKYYGLELLIARMFGFIKKENERYSMTTKGSYYYHYFEHFYTLLYIDQMWSLMKNNAFPDELIIH